VLAGENARMETAAAADIGATSSASNTLLEIKFTLINSEFRHIYPLISMFAYLR